MKKTFTWIVSLSLAGAFAACQGDGDGSGLGGAGGDGSDGALGDVCPATQVVCDDICVSLDSDRANCGACGTECAGGAVCEDGACVASCSEERTECDGGCVDTESDPLHCGGCDSACDFSDAQGACLAGECVFVRCVEGFADCDGRPENGCEADLGSDRRTCGSCDVRCDIGIECDDGECSARTSPDGGVEGDAFSLVSISRQCEAVDTSATGGDDRAGIAVSTSTLFRTGDTATVALAADDLSTPTALAGIYDGLVNDLKAEKVYVLADDTNAPFESGDSSFTRLLELDAAGTPSVTPVVLSEAVTTGTDDALFSGPGFFVHWYRDGGALTRIDFDGTVSELDPDVWLNNCDSNESWADFGIAEYFGEEVHLIYVSCNASVDLVRYSVTSGRTRTAVSKLSANELHSFGFLPSAARWYAAIEGNSLLGSGDEMAGYCAAVWSDSPCGPNADLGFCDAECVDLRDDNDNCGACGEACGSGEICADGVCDTCAEALLTSCGGTCRDLRRDQDNCGKCGNECGGDTPYCVQGKCSDASLSCKSTGNTSGVFTIVPDGEPIEVYCENEDLGGQGGGWTLLGIFSNTDDANWDPYLSAWTSDSTFGDATNPESTDDAKSAAYSTLPISEIAIVKGGVVQLVSVADCIDDKTLLEVMSVDSEPDGDCAHACDTAFVDGSWTGQLDQDDVLKFRCMDTDGISSVDGYIVSTDDNSFITTLDNQNNNSGNFGLGAGYPQHADWDSTTDDYPDTTDAEPVLLFGR